MFTDQSQSPSDEYAYIIDILSTIIVRLPFIASVYFIKHVRPVDQAWKAVDFARRLPRRAARRTFRLVYLISGLQWFLGEYAIVKPEEQDIVHVWVKAAPELLSDEMRFWAAAGGASPHDVLAYWTLGPVFPRLDHKSEKVVLNLDGEDGLAALRDVVHLRRVLSIVSPTQSEKQLEEPAVTTPTAFLQALSTYAHLIRMAGFEPCNVMLSGGAVALALARYLAENAGKVQGLPDPPGALLLISTWKNTAGPGQTLGLKTLSSLWLDGLGSVWKSRMGTGGLLSLRGIRSSIFS